MEGEKDWRALACESQLQYFETLGSRPFDNINKSDLFLLKKKVGFATCGKPSELPSPSNLYTGYNEENMEIIKIICDKIIEKSDCDPIKFACTVLILYQENTFCETSIFRLVTASGNIFIDAHARVYQDWDGFMTNNKLPACEYCYPFNGEYKVENEVLMGFAHSPASGLMSKAADCLDTAGSVVSVATAAVFAAGMFITMAPAVVTVAGTTAACTGVYSVSRSIGSLRDRQKHEQSIGLDDRESRSAWMSLASSTVGVLTLGAYAKTQKLIESGKSLSKLGIFGLHTLTASSVVFSGFGFVESVIVCADKYKKGVLTKQDVFDLSCELLFLFNAIASAHASTKLINSMSAVAEAPAQKKLTKTQKRNLRKRAAKRRAKGLTSRILEEVNPASSSGISPTLQLLLFEAVKAYAPRVEDIRYKCQSIGHDIMCWKTKQITDTVLLCNLTTKLLQLYNEYKEEIDEAITKILKYFNTMFEKFEENLLKLFEMASEELKSIFCTKVINLEDEVDAMINEAERTIIVLQDQLEVENIDDSSGSNAEENENLDDSELNPETKNLLSGCRDVIASASLTCNDLQEFGNILEGVKWVVVEDFKDRVSDYKKSLEAAKNASEGQFDIKLFHMTLGIEGDVGQYMFNKTVQNLSAKKTIYKIKTKCTEIENKKRIRTTPVWEGVTEGVFHYYGPHGSGDLSKSELISVVGSIVEKTLTEANCQILQDKDVVMIESNDEVCIQVVVYCGITEENTASGVILLVQ